MSQFVKFPSIDNFHTIYRQVQKYRNDAPAPIIHYRPKTKLHGTNAGVRIEIDGTVIAQKRTSDISKDSDNAGFAAWVKEHVANFSRLRTRHYPMTIFGEWAGPGIQKNVAVSRIENKAFFVFAVHLNGSMIVEPRLLDILLSFVSEDLHVLPWLTDKSLEFDFGDPKLIQTQLDRVNRIVAKEEKQDSYIADTFGVSDIGEGVVMVPAAFGKYVPTTISIEHYSRYIFKAKGEKHKVVKDRQAAQIDPETALNISAFVQLVATDNRLQQGYDEFGSMPEMKDIGPFLKWLHHDVQKECQAELEAAKLTWNQVQKAVGARGVQWFKQKVDMI